MTNDGITPLHLAAHKGHEEIVQVLLECGAKVDSKMETDITPLHLGAKEGHQEIIETILKFGADINSRDLGGRTALHFASNEHHENVVATLLDYGADINITSRKNYTPLHYAKYRITSYDGSDYYEFNNDYNCCDLPAGRTKRVLKRHILKLKTANLYVSKQNLQLIRDSDGMNDSFYSSRLYPLEEQVPQGMNDFQNECEKEIVSMKSEKINDLPISFYDILAKDTSSLTIYMRNENVVQVLKSDNYKTKFPLYARIIENNFKKGLKRIELLEQGNKIFHLLFNNLPELPYDCIENIFSYLSDEYLRNLIDACKPLDISNPNDNVDDAVIPSSSSHM